MIAINTSQPCIGFADTRQGGRAENQDTCAYSETPLGLLVTVCDGMGGGPSGKLASTIAASNIIATLTACQSGDDRVEALRRAVINANIALYQAMEADPSVRGMGTTVTALLLNSHSAVVAHVGDSRVYQLRKGKKHFRTFDHSMVFQMVKNGSMTEEQARVSANSNIILRALGHAPDLQVDVTELPYKKGDRFMLCSDGIWGMFPEQEILRILARNPGLGEAVESLVVKVDAAGVAEGNHHDNLTLAMVETTADSELRDTSKPWLKPLLMGLGVLLVLSILANVYFLAMNSGKDKDKPELVQEQQPADQPVKTLADPSVDGKVAQPEEAKPVEQTKEKPAVETPKEEATKKATGGELNASHFGIKPDVKRDAPKPVAKKEPAKAQPAKKEPAKAQQPAQQSAPKQEAAKQEAPKQEAAKAEAPKQDAPKTEAPKQTTPPAE